ncbi:hypothetical protein Agub_g10907 [Astrephomene gubernaculifera]|uniref:Centrosomal protein of 162 kDa n=1 Tax=Astrephomene gubernaculifera TaxID=47775 RepID=A0AAD3E0G0_9CHLO|nr:hypothetical protein Agub_g10907 [Astrephomene gubernaculifera]
MAPAQRSLRYSDDGNSGYEYDFEDDGDEVDVDAGQGDYDYTDGADNEVTEGTATRSFNDVDVPLHAQQATSPEPPAIQLADQPHTSSPEARSKTPTGDAVTVSQSPSSPLATHRSDSAPPADAPAEGCPSPKSPQPALPPLSHTLSPFLLRSAPAAHPAVAAAAAPVPPLPPRLPAASSSAPPHVPTIPPSTLLPSTAVATAAAIAAPSAALAPISAPSPYQHPPAFAHAAAPASPSQPSPPPSHSQQQQQQPHNAAASFAASPSPLQQHPPAHHHLHQQHPHPHHYHHQNQNSNPYHQHSQHQQQLAAAIRDSVDTLRASEQVRQLQAAVETLTGQLVVSERARAGAEGALVELSGRMQEQERRAQEAEARMTEAWEAKLLDKQREVQQLRTRVQQLETQGIKGRLAAASASTPRGSHQGTSSSSAAAAGKEGAAGGGAAACISPEEAATLRKELEQTELLIRGYQLENEAATRRIKELEESLAAAESRTAAEVIRTERAALLARDESGRRNADVATKLARVLALEKELEGVKEEAQTRESELRAQLEKLRAEKKALEAKAGGVDLKAMAEGDVLVKQLREEMEAGRQATQALIQEMQAKLSWYAENQEMLNKNDALVAEQRDIIQQLQGRLAQYEGQAPKGPAASRVAAANARVRELEAQVDQLQKALRSRAPANSLAAVVAAARPSPEEGALVAELREQVEALQAEIRGKDDEFELQLRTYQQQFEKLKAQYSERAGRLEAATKVRGRVKDLERQLEEQKGIYMRRVRELEAKLKAAQEHGAVIPATPAPPAYQAAAGPPSVAQTPTKAGVGAGAGPMGQPGAGAQSVQGRRDDLVPASQLRARELEVKKLQTELERRAKQVSELHLKLGEAESRILRLNADLRRSQHAGAAGQSPLPSRVRHDGLAHDDRPVGPSRGPGGSTDASTAAAEDGRRVSADLVERLEERCGNLTVENGSLRGQVAALGRQVAELQRELGEARAAAAYAGSDGPTAAEVSELRRQLDAAQLALTTVQRSATEAVERGAMAASEHQRAMLRLHDEVAYKEGLKWKERLATLEQELRAAQQRCEQAEGELAVARSRGAGAWSPEAAAFAAMERRLDEMAREMAAREAKWRAVLQDTQSLHGVQSDVERRKWESALAAKEAEVQATRAELQSLLQEVAQVQELQARAAAAQQQRLAARAQQQR